MQFNDKTKKIICGVLAAMLIVPIFAMAVEMMM